MNEEEQPKRTIIRNPPPDMEFVLTPEAEAAAAAAEAEEEPVEETPTRPSRAEVAAYQAGQAAGRAGAGIGRFLGGIGAKIETGEQSNEVSDDISDLFEGPDMERDNDVYTKDLTDVSEEDVFGEGGADMSDLLEVDEEVEEPEPESHPPIRKPKYRPRRRLSPETLRGLQI